MNAFTRIAGFTLGLAAIGGSAAALGAVAGPAPADEAPAHHTKAAKSGDHAGHQEAPVAAGLQVSQDGYTLSLADDQVTPSDRAALRFRILDSGQEAVTDYEREHGKDLHLIVVSRDLGRFQHVHPVLAADGTWSVSVDLGRPGEYRVYADFKPAGAQNGYTLGHDLSVSGPYSPEALPEPRASSIVDGYEVSLDGDLEPGTTSKLTLSVSRNGKPVIDLEPYLEAYGHLVALRDGDLAYLHVHPDGHPGDGATAAGPEITFYAEVPSAGTYRLFLDFKHEDRVHTADFTVPTGRAEVAPAPSESDGHAH